MQAPKILVIGDLMVDHYIWGNSSRISPEAPVPVVDVKEENNRLGGACNVANNLISLNAEVSLCGVIGRDSMGDWMINELNKQGIDIQYIFQDPTRPTTQKTRILISSQQALRVDKESRESISIALEAEILETLQNCITKYDAIILSDYDKGLLTPSLTRALITYARESNKPILCDPKGKDYSKYTHATLLTPNKKEAMDATGINIKDDQSLESALKKMQKDYSLQIALITLSEDGIGVLDSTHMHKIPTIAKEVYDVTGAGDSVIAALAYKLAQGSNIIEACEFANGAAAVVVGKVGSATATHEEINAFLNQNQINKYKNTNILQSTQKDEILSLIANLRSENKRIIFSNGCFDILHLGHIQYLQKAKKLGDVLIIGLNSDSSVAKLKGETRPINNEQDRAKILLALACIDYVIIFEDETPKDLISLIKPDILVKGADYKGKEIAGAEFAKEVRLIDFLEGRSSTNIIQKIHKLKEQSC